MQVMPSMRSMMTAGPALKKCNIAGYNCSYLPIDHPHAFDEVRGCAQHLRRAVCAQACLCLSQCFGPAGGTIIRSPYPCIGDPHLMSTQPTDRPTHSAAGRACHWLRLAVLLLCALRYWLPMQTLNPLPLPAGAVRAHERHWCRLLC